MDPATYARLTDIKRYIASEFEPAVAITELGPHAMNRRRQILRVLQAAFRLDQEVAHGSSAPVADKHESVEVHTLPVEP